MNLIKIVGFLIANKGTMMMQDNRILENSAKISLTPNEVMHLTSYYDSAEFRETMIYSGDDLGVTYHDNKIQFKLWAPIAEYVTLLLYKGTFNETPLFAYEMNRNDQGIFEYNLPLLYDGLYYLFELKHPKCVEAYPTDY